MAEAGVGGGGGKHPSSISSVVCCTSKSPEEYDDVVSGRASPDGDCDSDTRVCCAGGEQGVPGVGVSTGVVPTSSA